MTETTTKQETTTEPNKPICTKAGSPKHGTRWGRAQSPTPRELDQA